MHSKIFDRLSSFPNRAILLLLFQGPNFMLYKKKGEPKNGKSQLAHGKFSPKPNSTFNLGMFRQGIFHVSVVCPVRNLWATCVT
jgi:hypothetical protein